MKRLHEIEFDLFCDIKVCGYVQPYLVGKKRRFSPTVEFRHPEWNEPQFFDFGSYDTEKEAAKWLRSGMEQMACRGVTNCMSAYEELLRRTAE